MKYSSFEFPGHTVTVDVLTKDFTFDLHILSSYKDKIKKSNELVGAAFKGDYPLWWNNRTNKKHYSSQCSLCENTFVACDFNLHKCVIDGTVAEIYKDRPATVKRAFMPKIKRESVSHIPIDTLPDAPSRRKFLTDAKFVKTNYTGKLL